ncbi:MAG TPA: ribosome recycling factor [Alphaproteobacteria bacterium]|nr:ribosome recycling factor [Alphaproteobacteria bacterium]
MADARLADLRRRMDGALEVLKKEYGGLRTGRASVSLLEPIRVAAYGGEVPINQVASVAAADARLLTVQVWDRALVKAVEKAILASDLGLNPAIDGQLIRLPIPELSEERRHELAKVASKYAEQAKVAVRNVRRDGMELLKKLEKDGEISKDEHHKLSDQIQTLTDETIEKVSGLTDAKQKEIMHV